MQEQGGKIKRRKGMNDKRIAGIVIIAALVLVSLIFVSNQLSGDVSAGSVRLQKDKFQEILTVQVERYSRLTPQDLYKLVYQAAMGSAHAVDDVEYVREWLDEEIAGLSRGPEEPIVDVISPDGQMVRVNLRPFIAAGGDKEKLLEAFVRTANEFEGSEEKLRQYWKWAEPVAEGGQCFFTKEQMQRYFFEREIQGLPAVHHSQKYERIYKPAYRVVARKYLDGIIPKGD